MDDASARMVVKVIAVLDWIGAFFLVIGALFTLAAGSLTGMMGSMMQKSPIPAGVMLVAGVVTSVLFIVLAVLNIFVGIGLWKLRNWARIVTLVFAWIGGVLQVFGLLGSLLTFNIVGLIIGLIFCGIDAVIIWLFQFEPTVVGLFPK